MKIKIDPKKLQERLQEKQEKASAGSKKDPKNSIIVKPEGAGKLHFRAVYYPHSEDPSVEPFAERYYHYGFPGGAFYCPKRNCGEDCFICDFVWDRLKETKKTPSAKEWNKKLPQMCMLIPGVIRDREDEGCKFFRVATRDDKPSKNYSKIYDWFGEEDTCQWLDPDEGFDMVLTYGEPDEEQSKYLRGAKTILQSVDLARKQSKFGTKKEFEDFLKKIPNIDETVFEKKSTADSLAVLQQFREVLAKKAARSGLKAPEIDLEKSEGTSLRDEEESKPDSTDGEDFDSKLESLGL